jgi:hypothetical protein
LGVRPTLETAYLDLSRFLGTVRCGHTYANFYNQSDSVAATLFSGKTRLPFSFPVDRRPHGRRRQPVGR